MKKKLALFDFDGTISNKDSFIEFLIFSQGYFRLCVKLLPLTPVIIQYLFKLITNETAKEKALRQLFKGWDEKRWQQEGKCFTEQRLPRIIRPGALEKLQWHKDQGHDVYVVTASVNYWLEAWCTRYGAQLISTRLEMIDGKFTGNFLTRNCYRAQKVERIKAVIDLSQYDYIYAYGDSLGDTEMLAIANEAHYRYFA